MADIVTSHVGLRAEKAFLRFRGSKIVAIKSIGGVYMSSVIQRRRIVTEDREEMRGDKRGVEPHDSQSLLITTKRGDLI